MEKGFGAVPGRSRDKAKRLIAAAEEVGVDSALIRTTSQGYEVPVKVLDAYEKSVKDDGEPEGTNVKVGKGIDESTLPPATAEAAIEREQAGAEDSDNESDDASEDADNGADDDAAAAAKQKEADDAAAAAKAKEDEEAAAAKAKADEDAKKTSAKAAPKAKAEGK